MKSKFFSAIAAAILIFAGGALSAHATPLDKLIGKSLSMGNFFRRPAMSALIPVRSMFKLKR